MRSIPPKYVNMREDISSMSRPHEVRPSGVQPHVGWYNNASVAMGMQPNNSNIPWWPGPIFERWRAILGWWVAYRGEGGDNSTNTGVEISGHRLAVLRKNGNWETLYNSRNSVWLLSIGEDAVSAGDPNPWKRDISTGGLVISPGKLYNGNPQVLHGGSGKIHLWDGDVPDYDALHMVVRHRLVLINETGIDDRDTSNLIVQAGMDHYPTINHTPAMLAPATYVPSIAVGRFIKCSKEYRTSSVFVSNPNIDVLSNPPPEMI